MLAARFMLRAAVANLLGLAPAPAVAAQENAPETGNRLVILSALCSAQPTHPEIGGQEANPKAVFAAFDEDGDRTWSRDEFTEACRRLGDIPIAPEGWELKRQFEAIDANTDGKVAYGEMVQRLSTAGIKIE